MYSCTVNVTTSPLHSVCGINNILKALDKCLGVNMHHNGVVFCCKLLLILSLIIIVLSLGSGPVHLTGSVYQGKIQLSQLFF